MAAFAAVLAPLALSAELANGVFLVAKREMQDPRFQQTVVLITQPPDGGPFGVIVNRPLPHTLADVFPGHAGLEGKRDVVHYGGPVAPDGIMFLVRGPRPPVRTIGVLHDVSFVLDGAWIAERFKGPDATRGLRVFAGYSGWAPGQLQNEIQRGDWHVLPADSAAIFTDDVAGLWPTLIRRATSRQTRVAPPALLVAMDAAASFPATAAEVPGR